ncbi:hypothetical protein TRVL_02458 [Trypanosoma vivax]|nr:hypothetical protein TRVL_02458 [Trypanosoma vivax]
MDLVNHSSYSRTTLLPSAHGSEAGKHDREVPGLMPPRKQCRLEHNGHCRSLLAEVIQFLDGVAEVSSNERHEVLLETYRVLLARWRFNGRPCDLFEPASSLHSAVQRLLLTYAGYSTTVDYQYLFVRSEAEMPRVGCFLTVIAYLLIMECGLAEPELTYHTLFPSLLFPETRLLILGNDGAKDCAVQQSFLCRRLRGSSHPTALLLPEFHCEDWECTFSSASGLPHRIFTAAGPRLHGFWSGRRGPVCVLADGACPGMTHEPGHFCFTEDGFFSCAASCGGWSGSAMGACATMWSPCGPLVVQIVDHGQKEVSGCAPIDTGFVRWLTCCLSAPMPAVLVFWTSGSIHDANKEAVSTLTRCIDAAATTGGGWTTHLPLSSDSLLVLGRGVEVMVVSAAACDSGSVVCGQWELQVRPHPQDGSHHNPTKWPKLLSCSGNC